MFKRREGSCGHVLGVIRLPEEPIFAYQIEMICSRLIASEQWQALRTNLTRMKGNELQVNLEIEALGLYNKYE